MFRLRSQTVALILLLIGVGSVYATSQSQGYNAFTNEDGSFRVEYPKSFRFAEHGNVDKVRLYSYIPVCEKTASVCIAYPREKYADTTFEGAGFEINIVSAANEAQCLTPPSDPDTGVPGYSARVDFSVSRTQSTKVINGVPFEHGEAAGVAAGHVASTDLYRNFHNGHCYELSINITQSNSERTPGEGPRELSASESKRVRDDMERILESFRFLK